MLTLKDRLWRIKQGVADRADRRARLHFLHIGKNAGTQIKFIARHVNLSSATIRIVSHTHSVALRDLPDAEPFFFAIRRPDDRFKSGFYSRKRKGQPRIYTEWSPYEAQACAAFDHANDLAEALFEEGDTGFKALCAIKSISHCSMEQINWFDRRGYFLKIREPVGIIRQEHFTQDMGALARKLGFDIAAGEDPADKAAHRNDYSGAPPLSDKARRNLRDWYRQDFEFYARCEEWISNRSVPQDKAQ